MFLTSPNLPYYLLSRGHINAAEIIGENYLAVESRRRNRNFRVFTQTRDLFVKQVPAVFPEAVEGLEREALCYRLAATDSRFAALRALMPRYYDYDQTRHLIIVEFHRDAENLHELIARLGGYPSWPAQLIGETLGRFHCNALRLTALADAAAQFSKSTPWVLTVAQDASINLGEIPGGHREILLQIRASQELIRGLIQVRESWRPERLIHGDIRGDNFLFVRQAETLPPLLQLVDWELADIGDEAWDVAGVVATYLEYWLLAPFRTRQQARPAANVTNYDELRVSVWATINTFWQTYVAARGLEGVEVEKLQRRCVSFAAARLVRTAFDLVHGMAQGSPASISLLRTASLAMSDPSRAYSELLGFENKG